MAKKKKAAAAAVERIQTKEEKERDAAYIAYRKAKKACEAAKNSGNGALMDTMQQTEKVCFDRFLACEAALPEGKRFWKTGYRAINEPIRK